MRTRFLIILFVLIGIFAYHTPAFACSKSIDMSFFLPWNEYLHGNCSVTVGSLSWTGMIYIMIALIIPTIIVIRKKDLQKKFYLILPATVFVVLVLYSVFIYGTVDITQFAVPHGIYGGIDYDTVAWLETESDFARLLEKENVVYSEKNMDTRYDYANGINSDNLEYQIIMPAPYCGFAISDDGDEYWYTATFDKAIISSKLYKENPYSCTESEKCMCSMQERIRENFLEDEN